MAFELNDWLVKTLTKGVQNGTSTKEWAAVQLALLEKKGIVAVTDIERFDEATHILGYVISDEFALELDEVSCEDIAGSISDEETQSAKNGNAEV